jgi:hypothetical protein
VQAHLGLWRSLLLLDDRNRERVLKNLDNGGSRHYR